MNIPDTTYDNPYAYQEGAFEEFLVSGRISKQVYLRSIIDMPATIVESLIRNVSGPLGFKLRAWFYKFRLRHLGKNVLIGIGVEFNGPKNISIDDYTWIDSYTVINAQMGPISFGKRIHVAQHCVFGSRAPIVLEDYVAVAAGTKVYSNSERPSDGKRMSGPMVPRAQKAFYSAPIIFRKDSCVLVNSLILPGVTIGYGAVVGASSVIKRDVPNWDIVVGNGQKIGTRDVVDVIDD